MKNMASFRQSDGTRAKKFICMCKLLPIRFYFKVNCNYIEYIQMHIVHSVFTMNKLSK